MRNLRDKGIYMKERSMLKVAALFEHREMDKRNRDADIGMHYAITRSSNIPNSKAHV